MDMSSAADDFDEEGETKARGRHPFVHSLSLDVAISFAVAKQN